jgi:hypothetical protein
MKLFQVTLARVRTLEAKWRSTINKYRGPIPLGLAVASMVAGSNGDEDPVMLDASRRPIGIMQIPLRDGRKLGYGETVLKDTTNNIYVWCLKTNRDAQTMKTNFSSWWSEAKYDFWLAVRTAYLLGFPAVTRLFAAVETAGKTSTADVQTYLREEARRVGNFSPRDLKQIADHLDEVRTAMVMTDGPDQASYAFFDAPAAAPGGTNAISNTASK